jgi:hypothetical protein
MRACFLIATLAIVVCLPAYAETPNAPAADAQRIEEEARPSVWQRVLSTVIGQRAQSTVPDRTQDDEVWSEDEGAPAEEEDVAAPCKLCPQAPPARLADPPVLTAPRN